MKYIVIGLDKVKQEMWVLHGIYVDRNDAVAAAIRNGRMESQPDRFGYEVCDIAEQELELFRDYAELQAPPVDVPAPRTEDFTLTELFGMYAPIPANRDITTASPLTCAECGAAVSLPHRHQEFHNKLLP